MAWRCFEDVSVVLMAVLLVVLSAMDGSCGNARLWLDALDRYFCSVGFFSFSGHS